MFTYYRFHITLFNFIKINHSYLSIITIYSTSPIKFDYKEFISTFYIIFSKLNNLIYFIYFFIYI